MLKPLYTEVISAAAGVALSVAGVAVVGMGVGTARPLVTFEAAAATMTVTAANITLVNIIFEGKFIDVVVGLDVSGVAGFSIDNCHFRDNASNLNFLNCINVATGFTELSITNTKMIGSDAQNDTFLNMVAGNGLYMDNCFITYDVAKASPIGGLAASGDVTNVVIKDCYFRDNTDGALQIKLDGTANSGLISNCYFSSIDIADATTASVQFTGGHCFECYVAGDADSYGLIGGGDAIADN
jgi:hypothetical protein